MTYEHPKKSPLDRLLLVNRIWRGPERWLGLAVLVFIAFWSLTYSRTVAEHASRLFTKNKYMALVDGMLIELHKQLLSYELSPLGALWGRSKP